MTKRENVERILSWGNLSMPHSPLLSNHTLLGIGKPGPQYIMNSPDVDLFLLNFLSNWKSLLRDKRENFLEAAEAFNFASYLDQFLTNDFYKSDKALPVRHALLLFLFPDNFERAVSASGKEQILKDLIYLVNKGQISEFLGAGGNESQLAIDRAIFNLRSVLELVHDRINLDFYADPIDGSWGKRGPLSMGTNRKLVTILNLQTTIVLLPCATAC